MCGRYALNATPRMLARHFRLSSDQFELFPRYNIAPSQPMVIVRQNAHTLQRELTHVIWGLIPNWAKDVSISNRMINARSETAIEKPGYRGAMKYRRCLVPTSGFYEWRTVEGSRIKQPFYIRHVSDEVFAFAGLWEHWQGPGGEEIESCTILTTQPNELMATIHDRMPVILSPDDYDRWLDTTMQEPALVLDLLRPCDAAMLQATPVGTYVNSPRNEGEKCIATPVQEKEREGPSLLF